MTDTTLTMSARAALVDALDVVDRDPAERFERIVRTARDVFGVPLSYLNLVDDSTLYSLTPATPEEGRSMPLSRSFCQHTVRRPEPLVIPDTAADDRSASLPAVTELGIRFYAGVPLTMPGGVRVGALCLMDTVPRELSVEDEAALVDLSRWAERVLADGLEHDRLAAVVAATTPTTVDVPGYEVAGFSRPLGEVGGDVLDWSATDEGLSFTIADVMGKGPAAAILAAGLRGALRARTGLAPDTAVAGLEAQLAPEMSRAESFATLFHARLAPRSGRVDFVDAGHGIVLHVRADGTHNVLRSLDLPIGLHPAGIARASGSVVLQRGDALVVASDGVLELGDGTLDALVVLGRKLREADSVQDFLDVVRARAAERAEDDLSVLVVAREA